MPALHVIDHEFEISDEAAAPLIASDTLYWDTMGGDDGDGGQNAHCPGDAPVNPFAALMAFVAGVLAIVWAWEWNGPEWLVLPGWITAVLGGSGALIAAIPWLWRVMA